MTFSLITAIATPIVGLASMGVGVAADVRGSARLAVVTVGCVGVLVILVIIRFIFLG